MRARLPKLPLFLFLCLRTLPALAGEADVPLIYDPVPAQARTGLVGAIARGDMDSYRATLSGTLLKSRATPTTTWLLYPNGCNERAAGVWSPKHSPVADSLNTYDPTPQNHGYELLDGSLKEHLWHISDGSDAPDIGSALVISGSRSLWCGKYDENWLKKTGYPNLTYQILYIDTDISALGGGAPRTAPYTLTWLENSSAELNYDYLYLIGGGDGATDRDPLGHDRARLDKIMGEGSDGDAELLLIQTGTQLENHALAYVSSGQVISGDMAEEPAATAWSLSGIPERHRGLYFVFQSDCLFSSEDGLWWSGHGQVLDDIGASDQPGGAGNLYAEQGPAGGTDRYDGTILVTVNGQYAISARVPPGIGTVWTIAAGSSAPSADFCSPQKTRSADRVFLGADVISLLTIPGQDASVVTCSVPIPSGTGAVVALWNEYLDLPAGSGFVADTEFRVFRDGTWSNWTQMVEGNVRANVMRQWYALGFEIPEAALSDSVKVRFRIECIPAFAFSGACQPTLLGMMIDDLRIEAVSGTPAPSFGAIQPAQSTFVDGTDPSSVGCLPETIGEGRCWPGIHGSDQTEAVPYHDNFNCYGHDRITVVLNSPLAKGGMGINWKYGYDSSVAGGPITRLNATSYQPEFDTPRWIYRIFDPVTTTWSPWDSSSLFAGDVRISGADTTVIYDEFICNWPPPDKCYTNQGGSDIGPSADADLPGAPDWTLNGHTKYSEVPFLPRGARIQYYFKAADIHGGVAYTFEALLGAPAYETEDIPMLPGDAVRAPDVIVFSVLPSVYPPGSSGSLLAGRTDAKVLNLDSQYQQWWIYGYDPITQALRALGVRTDRYRRRAGIGGTAGFPTADDYGIRDLLANSYSIIIDANSSPAMSNTGYDSPSASLIRSWWYTDTGINGGDRCILGTGDALFNPLLTSSWNPEGRPERTALAQDVFGVAAAIDAWTGTGTTPYPTIDDRFAGGGPGLAAPGTFAYPLDGGCPVAKRFDGLTKIASSDASNAVIFPGGAADVAGVAHSAEKDAVVDNDRNKALAYGFSLAHIRKAGVPTTASNYVQSGLENRMRVLYKFLTSCRNNTAGATPCWPCPSNPAEMTSNWAAATGFETGTYGTLYPIQDYTQVTGVEVTEVPKVNRLEGNFPNPFNPATTIRFSAATPGKITIRIFDVAGRLVNTLSKNVTTAGMDEIRWNGKSSDGRSMASGLYFYRIRFANGQQSESKMTILK